MTDISRRARIRDYVIGVLLGGHRVDDEENLLLSGLVDSIGVMSLVSHLETAHGVTVPMDEVTVENFVSIAAIDAYLGGKVAA